MKPKATVYDNVVADKMLKLYQFTRTLPKCNSMKIKADLKELG